MASPTLTDYGLEKIHGYRQPGVILMEPYEYGYRCPKGHRGNLITWSEYLNHIWCFKCQIDYPSRTCPVRRQKWMDKKQFNDWLANLPFTPPKIISGVGKDYLG